MKKLITGLFGGWLVLLGLALGYGSRGILYSIHGVQPLGSINIAFGCGFGCLATVVIVAAIMLQTSQNKEFELQLYDQLTRRRR